MISAIYKKVRKNYPEIAVVPQFGSSVRKITVAYEAKALYSAKRKKIA